MIYVKIHKSANNFVTSLCDSELIGKKFKEGKLVLDVSERFYKGELVDEDKIEDYLKDAINVNLVGERVVDAALKLGFVLKENILIVEGVKHAQCIVLGS